MSQSRKWYEPILDWLKTEGGEYILTFILKKVSLWITSNVASFPAKIYILLFKYLVMPYLKYGKNFMVNSLDAKLELNRFVKIINKEGVTNDEIIDAEDDFFDRT